MDWVWQVIGVIAIIGIGELIKCAGDKDNYILIYGVGCMLIGMALF